MPFEDHKDEIIDTDAHFKIDGKTRAITNTKEVKNMVVKGDHNSERFTFELPRYIDGHDMTECNIVQIHYLNISTGREAFAGVYEVDDMAFSGETGNEVVTFSWLISQNATQDVGSLNFAVHFACTDLDNNLEYVWNTTVFSGVTVKDTISNISTIIEQYADIIEQWKQQLFGAGDSVINSIAAKGDEYVDLITQVGETTKTDAIEAINNVAQGNILTMQTLAGNAAESEKNAADSAEAAEADRIRAEEAAEAAQDTLKNQMGYYPTAAALKAAHPTGQTGNWAIIGETDTIWVWDDEASDWVDTHDETKFSNYYTKTQSDGRYSQIGHKHAMSDIVSLETTLKGKANTVHTHSISDITDLQENLNTKANINDISDKLIETYRHIKSGTEHKFIGTGSNGKVKMTADIATGDTIVMSDFGIRAGTTIEGETTQAGTGDPSPENIRTISGVGMYDKCVMVTGNGIIWYPADTYEAHAGYPIDSLRPSATAPQKSSYLHAASTIGNSNDVGFVVGNVVSNIKEVWFRLPSAVPKTEEAYKAYLNAHPLTVWYRSVDYAKSTGPYYTVVELSDEPYRAVGFELNQPLFDGDTLEVNVPSGCDRMVVLDGTENWLRDNSGTYYIHLIDAQIADVGSDKIQYSSSKYLWSPNHPNASNRFNIFEDSAALYIVDKDADDIPAFKQQLSDWASAGTPLTIFYRSVNYTPDKDIPVQLETHQQAVLVLDGTESIVASTTSSGGKRFAINVGNIPNVPSSIDSIGDILCSHYKPVSRGATDSGTQGISFRAPNQSGFYIVDDRYTGDSDVTNFKAYLASQHAAGTPVQVVYELATPAVYAHLPESVTIPAYMGPDDFVASMAGKSISGKWLNFTYDDEQICFYGGASGSGGGGSEGETYVTQCQSILNQIIELTEQYWDGKIVLNDEITSQLSLGTSTMTMSEISETVSAQTMVPEGATIQDQVSNITWEPTEFTISEVQESVTAPEITTEEGEA